MNWLNQQIEKQPEKPFIQSDKKVWSYLDISEMVELHSKALLKSGVKKQDKVLIFLPSSIEMVEIILSCINLGAISVPIDDKLTKNELDLILEYVKPSIIITNWGKKDIFSIVDKTILYIEELPFSASGCGNYDNSYKMLDSDICAIILTSGTTGPPKAVELTYKNFKVSCANWNLLLNFEVKDQFLCCLPLSHIGGFAVLLRALIYGFSIHLVNKFQAEKIYDIINLSSITIISLVPTMLSRIIKLNNGIASLKSLRYILLGGGPSHENLLDTCIKEKLPIIKVYGMTETCSGTFGLKLLEEPESKLYAGRPFPGLKVKIISDEIHVSGPMVMNGYLGKEKIVGGFNTRDVGYMKNGLLFLEMRRKDIIISGGKNINPIEIENHLIGIDGVDDAAVVGEHDNEWGQKVVAYIVYQATVIKEDSIKLRLKNKISSYKIPKSFIKVDKIPRNELGKIKYDEL